MREILFRGIPKDDTTRHFFADIWKDNCKGSFVYGSLIIDKDRYYICVSALCTINICINNGMTSMIEVIPETVGQYTGLMDKSGKKIFEGDIVKITDRNICFDTMAVIEFGNPNGLYTWGWQLKPLENKPFAIEILHWVDMEDSGAFIEVIGNVTDNPELLKGE